MDIQPPQNFDPHQWPLMAEENLWSKSPLGGPSAERIEELLGDLLKVTTRQSRHWLSGNAIPPAGRIFSIRAENFFTATDAECINTLGNRVKERSAFILQFQATDSGIQKDPRLGHSHSQPVKTSPGK
jgi:hypothetical protein